MSTASSSSTNQKVVVFDFGAQYGQLIARRVRDLNVYSEIVPCDITADEVREMAPAAIILSGGPASVNAEDAPRVDPAIYELGVPILGFCYGHQVTSVTLGAACTTPRWANTVPPRCTSPAASCSRARPPIKPCG